MWGTAHVSVPPIFRKHVMHTDENTLCTLIGYITRFCQCISGKVRSKWRNDYKSGHQNLWVEKGKMNFWKKRWLEEFGYSKISDERFFTLPQKFKAQVSDHTLIRLVDSTTWVENRRQGRFYMLLNWMCISLTRLSNALNCYIYYSRKYYCTLNQQINISPSKYSLFCRPI